MSKFRRRSVEHWREIISAQPGSGMSIAAYCRDRGISQPSFFGWRRRLRSAPGAPGFVEATESAAKRAGQEGTGIEVRVRGGRGLLARRGFDRDLMIELIRTLEGMPGDESPGSRIA